MKRLYAGVALSVCLVATPVAAEEYYSYTGNGLLEALQSAEHMTDTQADPLKLGVAFGRVTAVADIMEIRQTMCSPAGSTRGQLTAIVQKYLENHPETRHENDILLIMRALQEAWPCQ